MFISILSDAQVQKANPYFLEITCCQDNDNICKVIKYNKTNDDSLKVYSQLQNVITKLYANSYFYSKIQSIKWESDTCKVDIYIGDELILNKLKKGNLPDWMIQKIGYDESYFEKRKFSPNSVSKLCNNIIDYSQNNGYPFASVFLDSLSLDSNMLTSQLNFKLGPYFKFDTLLIAGKSKIKRKFLEAYLRIEKGETFNQSKINNIENALKQLPYLKLNGPISVFFNEGLVRVEVVLEDNITNQVDGIVGMLPNSQKDGGVLLTGELNLVLRNLFQSGKVLKGEWRRFQQESQLLNLYYYHSNLFYSDFDVSFSFNFLKQDSTFLNMNRKFSFLYRLDGKGKLALNFGFISSRLGSNNNFKSATVLPSYSDYDYISYGLGYEYNNLDNIFYPRKGFLFQTDVAIGNKDIIKNSILNDDLYANTKLHTFMIVSNMNIEKYIKLKGNSVLLLKSVGGKVANKNIFFNDLYRLGGLKSIRGFNDNYFYASDYIINTLEFRQYLDESSFLLLFAEQSYIYYNLTDGKLQDYPTGLGVGVNFTSGSGIFSFVYSVGKSKQQQISLNQSKIHFGFVSRF